MDKQDEKDIRHTADGEIRQAEKTAAAEKDAQVRSGSDAIKANTAADTEKINSARVYPNRSSKPSEGTNKKRFASSSKGESISVMVARTAGRKAASAVQGTGEKALRSVEDQLDPDMTQQIKAVEGAIRSGGSAVKAAADTVKSGVKIQTQWDKYKKDKKAKAAREAKAAGNTNQSSLHVGPGLYGNAEYQKAKNLSGKASKALQKSKKAGKSGKDAGRVLRATGRSAGVLREATETGSEVVQAVTGGVRLASAGVKAASEAAAVVGTAGTAKIAMGVADTAVKPIKVLTKKLQEKMKRKNGRLEGGFLNELFRDKRDAAGESVGKASNMLHMILGIGSTVCGGIMLLFLLIILIAVFALYSLISSPLRYVYFTVEQLSAVTEYFDDTEDSELRDLYTEHVADLQAQAADLSDDGYKIIYAGHEGTGMPDNYRDVLSVFLGICTSGEAGGSYNASDALVLTESAKNLFQDLLAEMCSIEVQDRNQKAVITMMSCTAYINAHELDPEAANMVVSLYTSIASVDHAASGAGNASQEELPEDIARYLEGLTHLQGVQGTVISSALAKLGMPYSQAQRDSGSYYDCSSFVYYSYKSAGVSMVYGGANTAAAEAQYCATTGQIIAVEDLQPGDLLFYSYVANGRYKNISHVEMYLGNGLIIDCTEAPGVSVRQFTTDKLVLCGRPY